MSEILNEAFQALNILNEDTFNIDSNGIEKVKDIMDVDDEVDELNIIDPNATSLEDVETPDHYLNKIIISCNVCREKQFKNEDEIVISDEDENVCNVGEVCPICQSTDGFTILGMVKPFKEETEVKVDGDEEKIDVDLTEEEKEDFDLDEALRTKKGIKKQKALKEEKSLDDIDADMDDKKERAKARYQKVKDDARSDRDYKVKKLKEAKTEIVTGYNPEDDEIIYIDAQEIIDDASDIADKKFTDLESAVEYLNDGFEDRMIDTVYKIGKRTKEDFKDFIELDESVKKLKEAKGKRSGLSNLEKIKRGLTRLPESLNEINIETDKEKIKVTSEPKEEEFESEEVEDITAEPVDQKIKDSFKTESDLSDEEEDVDITDFDEESFDELGESYLKKVYENVDSYKTTSGSLSSDKQKIKLEGMLTFKSGKKAKTNFIFEGHSISNTNKVTLIGSNKQFARGNKTYSLKGRVDNGKFITESLTYNYSGKDDKTGKVKKLYGRVGK